MKAKKYMTVLMGTMLEGFAVSVFYNPNKLVKGGAAGVAIILYHTFGIPTGISYALINIILLLIAFKVIGFQFVRDTILGSMLASVFVQIFSYLPPMTENIMLAAVFGSVCTGVGVTLTFIAGASTGGTDILGRLFQVAFPHIKIGSLLMFVNSSIVLASFAVFRDTDLLLYGIAALFISGFSVNILISKLNISKLAFVVTDKGEEVSQMLVSESQRGVTMLEATGAYTMKKRNVLMCALKENELPVFQRRVLSLDDNAFIIFSESQQIVGNGFRIYK